ncbi:hypothetical protein Pla163_27410 [Planctomycetes bacterium Pla163]|uniref:Uncharacterized protein n=1 Tax=Rohdeia mirabilis TaxID=2528008 RepID=A0A518D2D0_9BACT|nr:hypothetical protein Pla163_27410 [Planctomycetes bacterium Pla163]
MRTFASLLAVAALLVFLPACRTTTENDRVEYATTNFEALVDGASDELGLATRLLEDAPESAERDALALEIDAALRLVEELRGELERANATGRTEEMQNLTRPVIVLVQTASLLAERAGRLGADA